MNEAQELFNGPLEVAGYTVKPWTVKGFDRVYPSMKSLVSKLLALGLTLDNLGEFLQERGLELLPELQAEIPPLLAATLEIPLEEAEEMDWMTAGALTLTIVIQNLAPLKNLLPLVQQVKSRIRGFTP